MSGDVDDRVRKAVRNVVEKKAEELMNEMKSTSPRIHPNPRYDTDMKEDWIKGDTVNLQEWR